MRDRVWLAIDLAAGKNFPALHRWLAAQQAKECGPNLFTFFFEYQHDLTAELKTQVRQAVNPAEGDRLYLIYKDYNDGEVTGAFLFGERGLPPWQKTN
jgi:hypothetical protein